MSEIDESPYVVRRGKFFYGCRPGMRSAVCPVCGKHRKPVVPRALGFALAGFANHIFTCYEGELKKLGWKEGRYVARQGLHRLVRLGERAAEEKGEVE